MPSNRDFSLSLYSRRWSVLPLTLRLNITRENTCGSSSPLPRALPFLQGQTGLERFRQLPSKGLLPCAPRWHGACHSSVPDPGSIRRLAPPFKHLGQGGAWTSSFKIWGVMKRDNSLENTSRTRRLMRPKELADALSVSKRWVLYQAETNTIPVAFRRGRVIRFSLRDVMEELTKP